MRSSHPQEVGHSELFIDLILSVQVIDDQACLATAHAGLRSLSVRSPAAPDEGSALDLVFSTGKVDAGWGAALLGGG